MYERSAIISQDKQYRYLLIRQMARPAFHQRPPLAFIMLNPSTADGTTDDPTIRRLLAFAKTRGHNDLIVGNLYGLRSPYPDRLWSAVDPVGPDNNRYLAEIARDCPEIVCAWGANAPADRAKQVVEILGRQGAILWCLGRTKNGSPRHPLYVKGGQPLEPFSLGV